MTRAQSAVYEEFARNIPGFKPLSDREIAAIIPKSDAAGTTPASAAASPAANTVASSPPTAPAATSTPASSSAPTASSGAAGAANSSLPPSPSASSDECVAILKEILSKVEPFVQGCTLPATPHMANLHALVEAMNRARGPSRDPAHVAALVDKAVESLLQGLTVQVRMKRNTALSVSYYEMCLHSSPLGHRPAAP